VSAAAFQLACCSQLRLHGACESLRCRAIEFFLSGKTALDRRSSAAC
jgi:hypothetical protein